MKSHSARPILHSYKSKSAVFLLAILMSFVPLKKDTNSAFSQWDTHFTPLPSAIRVQRSFNLVLTTPFTNIATPSAARGSSPI